MFSSVQDSQEVAVGVALWVSELHADLKQTLKTPKHKRWAPAVNITLVIERKGKLNDIKFQNHWATALEQGTETRPAPEEDQFNSNINFVTDCSLNYLEYFFLFSLRSPTLVTTATPPSSLATRPCMIHLKASFTWIRSSLSTAMLFSLKQKRKKTNLWFHLKPDWMYDDHEMKK